jgi:hypothetical protein
MADPTIIPDRFWLRRGQKSVLPLVNEVLYAGEVCFEYDPTRGPNSWKAKVGDGATPWTQLPYIAEVDPTAIMARISLRV